MTIKSRTIKVSTAGSNGSATGEATSPYLSGKLLDIYLNFNASTPASTHTTIAHVDAFRGNILAIADTATDALYAPRIATHKTDGTASGAYDQIALAGPVKITLINSNAVVDALVCIITYES